MAYDVLGWGDSDHDVFMVLEHREEVLKVPHEEIGGVEFVAVQPDMSTDDVFASALAELPVVGQQDRISIVRVGGQLIVRIEGQPGLIGCPGLMTGFGQG